MKALIRNKGETITEEMDVSYIDWRTGAPLTNEAWCGGPYTLIENYVPEVEEDLDFISEEKDPQVEEDDDYVIIDGKRYSKEELRSLIE